MDSAPLASLANYTARMSIDLRVVRADWCRPALSNRRPKVSLAPFADVQAGPGSGHSSDKGGLRHLPCRVLLCNNGHEPQDDVVELADPFEVVVHKLEFVLRDERNILLFWFAVLGIVE